MRVAFVGKGGSGKSAVAGTFARLLARTGARVLAVDSDPMPGLAYSLGAAITDAGLPDDLVVERADGEPGPRLRLRPGLDAADLVKRHAAVGPDGVRLLQFGKLRGHARDSMRSQVAFRLILDHLPAGRWSVVGDLPGGTRQPYFGWGSYARTFAVVVEPTAKSMLAARRLAGLARTEPAPRMVAVVNKARDPGDVDLVTRRTGLDVVGEVPWDDELAEAERLGRAPIDHSPRSPAVRAVGSLVERWRRDR